MTHAHRAPRRSGRLRALLSLGIVFGLGAVGTFAFWTDEVPVTGATFTAGTLDLQVNNQDAYATTTLSMSNMVPGNTSAEVLTVKNNGTVPLKYTLTGGLSGTHAAEYHAASALSLTIRLGGAKSGTGNTSTCTGGTVIYGPTALTNVVSTGILTPGRGPIAVAGSEGLCFQFTFSASAPSSLQGKTATATFGATGTSDLS